MSDDKVKRESMNISLPPELKERLQRESETRMFAPSFFVEKALLQFFATLDGDEVAARRAVKDNPQA